MTRKIKLNALQVLFRMFAFLADKSGGWRVFVHPKLLLGSLIVGFGLTVQLEIEAQSQNTNQLRKKAPNDKSDTIISKEVEDLVYCYVTEQMPQYPKGESELLQFISKNLKYPQDAVQKGIQGKVICRFLVTEKGSVTNVKIIRNLYPSLDNEAVRILKLLPIWIPGKQNGVNVSVWYTIPIIFKLEK